VLGNTAVTLEQLAFFKDRGCSTFCWMHEMDYALDLNFSHERFGQLAEQMDGLIVGSRAVHEMLVQRGIERPVSVVYEFLDTTDLPESDGSMVRNELGIPEDAFVAGACAAIEWRKGVDLFIQIAKRLTDRHKNVYCLWVGGRYPRTQTAFKHVQYDIRKLGLTDRIIFVDHKHDLSEYYSAMDVFLLPSREDPFPLVCLEAALAKKPVVCFQAAGGMPEFVEQDCGFVIPYLDVDAAADKIGLLQSDPVLRARLGTAAAAKALANHDVAKGSSEILEILKAADRGD
jgi:glycosyltransferase involved in cell wall biosynthesis